MIHKVLLCVLLVGGLQACAQEKHVVSDIDSGVSATGVTLTLAIPGGQITVKADRLSATADGQQMRFEGNATFAVQSREHLSRKNGARRGFEAGARQIVVTRSGREIALRGGVRARFAQPIYARDAGAPNEATEVQSQRLKIEHSRRRAVFTGQVRATYRGLSHRDDKMVVKYNAKGGIISLQPGATVP
jgi:lipopolysaccharide export system protein LptA